jgi:hypothetical protein
MILRASSRGAISAILREYEFVGFFVLSEICLFLLRFMSSVSIALILCTYVCMRVSSISSRYDH